MVQRIVISQSSHCASQTVILQLICHYCDLTPILCSQYKPIINIKRWSPIHQSPCCSILVCSAHIRLLHCHLLVHFESNRLQLMFRKRRKKDFNFLLLTRCKLCSHNHGSGVTAFWETFALQVLLETADVYLWQHDFSQDFYIHCIPPSSHFFEFPQWYWWMQCYNMFLIEYTSCILLHWCHYPDSHDITSELLLFSGEEAKDCRAPQTWHSRGLWGSSTGEHPLRRPLKIKIGV